MGPSARVLACALLCSWGTWTWLGCGEDGPNSGSEETPPSRREAVRADGGYLAGLLRHLETEGYDPEVVAADELPRVHPLHDRLEEIPGSARPETALESGLGDSTGYVYAFASAREADLSMLYFFRRHPDGDGVTTCGRVLYFVDVSDEPGPHAFALGRKWSEEVADALDRGDGCTGSLVVQ